jgi:hypothetical protein
MAPQQTRRCRVLVVRAGFVPDRLKLGRVLANRSFATPDAGRAARPPRIPAAMTGRGSR